MIDEKRAILGELLDADRPDLANVVAAPMRKARPSFADATFEDLIAAQNEPDYTPEEVTAASLARMWQHFQTDDRNVGVLVVSADRGDRAFYRDKAGRLHRDKARTEKLNQVMRKRLEPILLRIAKTDEHPSGFIRTMGGYQEEGGVWVEELSYFVPGVTKDQALKLARIVSKGSEINDWGDAKLFKKGGKSLADDFRQESVLWGNNLVGAFLIEGRTGKFDALGKLFKANDVRNYYTEWKRRRRARSAERKAAEDALRKARGPGDIITEVPEAVERQLYKRKRFGFGKTALATIRYIPDSPSDYRTFRAILRRIVFG